LGLGTAYGINNRGDVAAAVVEASGISKAVLYIGGKVRDLGAGNNSAAYGLNNLDEVVGTTNTIGGHAFLYKNGKIKDLTPNAVYGEATGINDSGEVTGRYATANSRYSFLFINGQLHNIGAPGTQAWGINNAGQIVGGGSAFIYTNGWVIDINGGSVAIAINQASAITRMLDDSFRMN
jgi:probable HAF family extracellular repeat protein